MAKYLQVVDESNKPTSKKVNKKEVHERNLWHRTVQIWVLDNNNRLLLVKRGKWKRQDPGMWASYIGGHNLYGESYLETAVRETKEEIGIKVIVQNRFLPIVLKKSRQAKEFTQLYLLRFNSNEKIIPSKKEFTDYTFVKPSTREINIKTKGKLSGGSSYLDYQISKLFDLK